MKQLFYPSPNQTTTCLLAEVKALAASAAHGQLEPFSYYPGPLGAEEVEPDADYKVRATVP